MIDYWLEVVLTIERLVAARLCVPGATENPKSFISGVSVESCNNI